MNHQILSVTDLRNFGIALMLTSLTLASPVLFAGSAFAASPVETTLYEFQSHPDGGNPTSPVIFDKAGNIYGTTSNGGMYGFGSVFELSPPTAQGGPWTETVIYNFEAGSDGANPSSGLVLDSKGNLYGEVWGGSVGRGDVFQLTPPPVPGGSWTYREIYLFCVNWSPCPDGGLPAGGLAVDKNGNLYGTTLTGGFATPGAGCCGVVFKLAKPHGKVKTWTQSVLYTFTGFLAGENDGGMPDGGVVLDKSGNVYGTTYYGGDPAGCGGQGCGTIFELSPSGSTYNETILYAFHGTGDGDGPKSNLIFDKLGALYGTASGEGAGDDGNAYKLSPPTQNGGTWQQTVLYTFKGLAASDGADPQAALKFVGKSLYGTTAIGGSASCDYGSGNVGCGIVFKLLPTGSSWKETVLWNFGSDGSQPEAPLIFRKGAFYGTGSNGGNSKPSCQFGTCGSVFELVP